MGKEKSKENVNKQNQYRGNRWRQLLRRELRSLLKYTMIVLVLCVTLVGALGWWLFRTEHLDAECFARDEVVVKIGDSILALQRRDEPMLYPTDGKQIPYADTLTRLQVCQKADDPPIEVERFYVHSLPLKQRGFGPLYFFLPGTLFKENGSQQMTRHLESFMASGKQQAYWRYRFNYRDLFDVEVIFHDEEQPLSDNEVLTATQIEILRLIEGANQLRLGGHS